MKNPQNIPLLAGEHYWARTSQGLSIVLLDVVDAEGGREWAICACDEIFYDKDVGEIVAHVPRPV